MCTVTRRGSALYGSMSELLRAPGYSVLEVLEFSQINIIALSIMSVICACATSVSGSGFVPNRCQPHRPQYHQPPALIRPLRGQCS